MTDRYQLNTKIACVVDSGGYTEIAIELSKVFSTVYYFVEWREPFPTYHKKAIGTGIENVVRIYNLDTIKEKVDFWYFTDLFYGEMASQLRKEGNVVFGAGIGEKLELDRKYFKDLMVELGMPVNENVELIGMTALREYLKQNEDVYVKLNADMRGHLESSHSENYNLFKPVLDSLEHALGFDSETAEFLVEKPIRPAVEYGYDGYFSGGGYPNMTMFGLEVKDASYCSVGIEYNRLPSSVKKYNKLLAPILQEYDYRGAIGNEIRHQEGSKPYLIDIYTRQGQPPTSIQIRMVKDFPIVAYEIGLGKIPDIEFNFKYGVQLIIKSDWAKTEPQPIYFDENYRDNISIKNLAIKYGTYYYIPMTGCEMEEIGAIVYGGNTLK